MAELLVGKDQKEVDRMTESFKAMMHGREPEAGLDLGDLEALEGVRQFPVRIKCALLAWTTLQEALAAFTAKKDEAGAKPKGAAGAQRDDTAPAPKDAGTPEIEGEAGKEEA